MIRDVHFSTLELFKGAPPSRCHWLFMETSLRLRARASCRIFVYSNQRTLGIRDESRISNSSHILLGKRFQIIIFFLNNFCQWWEDNVDTHHDATTGKYELRIQLTKVNHRMPRTPPTIAPPKTCDHVWYWRYTLKQRRTKKKKRERESYYSHECNVSYWNGRLEGTIWSLTYWHKQMWQELW